MEKAQKEKDQKQEEKKEIVSRAAESAQHVNRVTVQKKEIVNKIKFSKINKKEVDIMPRGDRTGPNGLGPMTGRRMGFCTGYNTPGYMNPGATEGAQNVNRFYGSGRGQGLRRGFGQGFGRRANWNYETPIVQTQYKEPTKEEFLKELEAEKADLEKVIKELKKEKK